MSFVNIDCQPFAVSVQQPVLFIEWPFLEDDVDHLSDHNWALCRPSAFLWGIDRFRLDTTFNEANLGDRVWSAAEVHDETSACLLPQLQVP